MIHENRILRLKLDDLNTQRAAAGAAPVVAPMNSRATAANAELQRQQHQSAFQNNQSTGTVGEYNAADARDWQMANLPKQDQYGNPTAAGFLGEQEDTYANQQAGLRTSYDTSTGATSVAGNGAIQDRAIERLRESGMSEDQIRMQMESTQPQIQDTMSNTGLGGSFDPNTGMFIPASGRDDIKASRKSELDATKGYDSIPQYDKKGNIVGYKNVENPQKTAELRAKKQESFDAEDAYDQKVQARADADMSSRDAGMKEQEKTRMDAMTTKAQADRTIKNAARMAAFDSYLSTLSPEDQKLMAPYRMMLEQQNSALDEVAGIADETRMQGHSIADEIADGQSTMLDIYARDAKRDKEEADAFLKQQKDDAEATLREREANEKMRLSWEENSAVRTAESNKTKILEDMAAGAALSGTAFSSNAIQAMSRAEQQANDSISELKMQYGFKRTDVDLAYTEKYKEINQTYLKGLFDSMKDYRAEKQKVLGMRFTLEADRLKEHQRVDELYGKTLSDLAMKKADGLIGAMQSVQDAILEEKKAKRASDKADEDREWQQRKFYENMDYQFAKTEAAAERSAAKEQNKQEFSESKLVYSDFEKVRNLDTVQNYESLRDTAGKIEALVGDAKANPNDPQKIGSAITLALTLTAKGSDPTTGVRDGELVKFGMAQTRIDQMKSFAKALTGGDTTGISIDVVEAYSEAMMLLNTDQQQAAQAAYMNAFNRLVEFNSGAEYHPINPVTISLPEGITIPSWVGSNYNQSAGSSTNWMDDDLPAGGGETTLGQQLSSLGSFTQEFDTPIASTESGGLYAQSTVDAWGGKHAGVDIAVPQGSAFESLVDGEIIELGDEKGWGGTIVVRDAQGGEHRISHLSELNPNLKKGDTVTRGQILAKTGGAKGEKGSGNSTGAHIDYRVRYNGKYVNPLQYHA